MSNNQLREYYRKDAEQEVKFKYEQEISDLKKKNKLEKERSIINTKQAINDKYIKKKKQSKNKYAEELDIEYANIEKEFENIIEIFDKETDKLTIPINDQELTGNIKLINYENDEEFKKKIRDTIRNAKGNLRKIKQERRALRRNLINDIIQLKQEKKFNAQLEIDTKYNDIYEIQISAKNNSLNIKMTKIDRIWDEILKANIKRLNSEWEKNEEEKIQSIITKLIENNKSRIINSSSKSNQSSILNMTKTLNDRLLTEWNMEKKKKITYKLRNIDSSIKALKLDISRKWKTQEEHINQKYDKELENKLQEIDISIKKYNDATIQNYKTSILNNIKISNIELDRNDFETESEYTKKLRDEERQKHHELRKRQKEFRKNKTIPDTIKKQLEIYKKKIMEEKYDIKKRYQQIKIHANQKLLQEKNDNIINEVKKLTEKLINKAEQEVDILKESWISKKKEESILLNKVKDNNFLEVQIIQLNEQLRSKNSIITELQQRTEKLLKEKNNFQTEITKLNKYITQYKKDKDFVDKLKTKYMAKENLKEKKTKQIIKKEEEEEEEEEKKIQNIAKQIKEPENSLRTLTAKKKNSSKVVSKVGQKNKKEMEKKLLMKMTLREKGPLFEHNYICTGIYRKETDFEILLKAKNKVIIHLKFDYRSNFINIITTDNNISLSCIFEPDTYYEIIFTFNHQDITVNINDNLLGSYNIHEKLLEDIIVRIKSTRSIFYHQYIKFLN
jgi:hypothetical protein